MAASMGFQSPPGVCLCLRKRCRALRFWAATRAGDESTKLASRVSRALKSAAELEGVEVAEVSLGEDVVGEALVPDCAVVVEAVALAVQATQEGGIPFDRGRRRWPRQGAASTSQVVSEFGAGLQVLGFSASQTWICLKNRWQLLARASHRRRRRRCAVGVASPSRSYRRRGAEDLDDATDLLMLGRIETTTKASALVAPSTGVGSRERIPCAVMARLQ